MAKIIKENGELIIRNDWHPEDIESVAEGMDVELTDDQIKRVMQLVVMGFDANVGINWDVIESAIETVLRS